MCDSGWYSGGDFFPSDISSNCDQNTNAIRGLGIMLALLSGAVIPLKARFTYLRYTTPMAQKVVQNIQCGYGLANVVYESSICIYGILKAISPADYQIGAPNNGGIDVVNSLITISFFSLMFTAAVNLSIFLEGTMKIFPIHGKKFDRINFMIQNIKAYGIVFPILGGILSIFPYFDLASQSDIMSNQYIFNYVFLIGYYIIMTFQGSILILLLTFVTDETGSYLADQAKANVTNETVTKISGIHKTLSRQWLFTTGRVILSQSWIIFTSWGYLRRKFTYFFCIQYLFTYFTGLLSLKSLWNFPRKEATVPVTNTAKPVEPSGEKYHIVHSIQVAPAPIDEV